MTGIIAHWTNRDDLRVWTDDHFFAMSGEQWPCGAWGKVARHTIRNEREHAVGDALVAHAGTAAVGQYLAGLGFPAVSSADNAWSPTQQYLWLVMHTWQAALSERGLWHAEEQCAGDGSDELLVMLRGTGGEPLTVVQVDATLATSPIIGPWATAGVAGATMRGALQALDRETALTTDKKVETAFAIAREAYAFVGSGVHVHALGG